MTRMSQLLSVLIVLYLLSGIPAIWHNLSRPPSQAMQTVAGVYSACIVLGLLGCLFAFTGRARLFRWSALLAMGVAAFAYQSNTLTASYPGFFNLRLTFSFVNAATKEYWLLGVSVLPGVLFLATWWSTGPQQPPEPEPQATEPDSQPAETEEEPAP